MEELKFKPVKRTMLTVAEVAEYLGVSTDLVYNAVRKKKLPYMKLGRRIIFKMSVLEEWVENQMFKGLRDEQ